MITTSVLSTAVDTTWQAVPPGDARHSRDKRGSASAHLTFVQYRHPRPCDSADVTRRLWCVTYAADSRLRREKVIYSERWETLEVLQTADSVKT